MKKHLVNAVIIILIFIITLASMILSVLLREGDLGISKGLGLFITYILVFGITAFSLSKFSSRIHPAAILITIAIPVLLLILPKALNSTLKFSLKLAPYYLSVALGMASGYLFAIREHQKFKLPMILAILPLIMAFGTYDLWVHKVEYGTWTGDVTDSTIIPFEFTDKQGGIINNEALKGKVVLFDFWFISCGPCWVKFPELQRLYEQYASEADVKIYAVNRPMRRDKPGELFTSIEEKGYSFPVLAGTQALMDSLNIYKYPTVVLLNKQGQIVFMGELEEAEKKIPLLLEE